MFTIEESQGYQIVCENVTSKRGRDIKLFVRMLHRREAEISNYQTVYVNVNTIDESQGYQIVCENVTSKKGRSINFVSNVTWKRGRDRDIKLFM
jgi:hypothetical protein